MPAPPGPTITAAMLSKTPYLTPEKIKLAKELGSAIATTWGKITKSIIVAPMIVSAGAAPPGGPVVGAIVTLTPGMLNSIVPWFDLNATFQCSFTGLGLANTKSLVATYAAVLSSTFPLWVSGFTATLVGLGGVAAWIPPAPPVVPAPLPGPWGGGLIVPLPLAAGTSPGEVGFAVPVLTAKTIAQLPPSMKQLAGAPTPELLNEIKAFWLAFLDMWTIWKATTMITGGVGSGVALPAGVISPGTHAGALLS